MERGGKGFDMVEAGHVTFRRHPEAVAVCDAGTLHAKTFTLEANAYILNADGKTIETFFVNGADRKGDHR